jgi:group I intron endonuclease
MGFVTKGTLPVSKSPNPVIYKIRNVVNQKFYVGSTINAKERFRTHRNKLRRGVHHTPHLQAAWDKYGEECFKFEVVEEVASVEMLQDAEDCWLVEHIGKLHCYNAGLRSGAPWRGVSKEQHPSFGRPKTPETIAAISAGVRERYQDPTYAPRTGKKHSEETKATISAKVQQAVAEGRGGKFTPSEETRLRMSQALKGNQNAKGHVRSEEHRRRLSEANKGNQNWFGKTHTEEAKAKLSKRVLELTTNTEFPSLTAALEHYGFKMPTLRRALLTGNVIAKGVHKGLRFVYVEPPEGAA